MKSPRPAVALAALLVAGASGIVRADESPLSGMSLEDLSHVQVSTASRRSENLFTTPASVHVVTADDIRRAGARTVPDMLRLIPGVQVAQLDSHLWAVSVRGFNWTYASKLLVMVDGRSVYTPLTAGVDWDSLGLLPENVDRIEIVRGSAASVWGANAVNGVINILTKTALDTQGTDAGLRLGSDSDETWIRHGDDLAHGAYRFDVRVGATPGRDVLPPDDPTDGDGGTDAWRSAHAGFRWDRELRAGSFTLEADATRGAWTSVKPHVLTAAPYVLMRRFDSTSFDGSVQGRWTRRRDHGDVTLRVFHWIHDRQDADFEDRLAMTDVDLQANRRLGRNVLTWGGGIRHRGDVQGGGGSVRLSPARNGSGIWSLFVQDEMRLPGSLRFVTGARLEHRESTGLSTQPHARLLWSSPAAHHAAWIAVTRAVRTPSRIERALDMDVLAAPGDASTGGLPVLARVTGDMDLRAERVVTREAGYRFHAGGAQSFDLDVTLFHSSYGGIISAVSDDPWIDSTRGLLIVPQRFDNAYDVSSTGAEIETTWTPRGWMTLSASAGWTRLRSHAKAGITSETSALWIDGQTPRDQQSLRTSFRLGPGASLDSSYEHVAPLACGVHERHDVGLGLDLRLGDHATLRLQGVRLFAAPHAEILTSDGSAITKAGPEGSVLFGWRF